MGVGQIMEVVLQESTCLNSLIENQYAILAASSRAKFKMEQVFFSKICVKDAPRKRRFAWNRRFW